MAMSKRYDMAVLRSDIPVLGSRDQFAEKIMRGNIHGYDCFDR
jgi:hypothetical protein